MPGTGEPSEISLRPVAEEDSFLIRRWLADPCVQACWGSRAAAEAEVTLALASPSALCRIVTSGHGSIGYAQAIETGLRAGPQPPDQPAGTWDVVFFIASPVHQNRHALAAVPAALVAEVFATTLAVACSALVPIRHEMIARAYERAGFRWTRILHDPLLGPAWLMLKERPR